MFGGYHKACHTEYKYDSVPEYTLSIVLEKDDDVIKWLRPASKQFKIWYQGGRLYEPDFIIETADIIYMAEVKNKHDMDDDEVKLKARVANKYCEKRESVYRKKAEICSIGRYLYQAVKYIGRNGE